MINNLNYFDTLAEALDQAAARAYDKGAEFEGEELLRAFSGGVRYLETLRAAIPLTKFRGSITRAITRGLTIVIYRLETGRYEMTSYIS